MPGYGRIEETGWRLPQQGFRLPATDFVANAHKAGLKVHLWAIPAENVELPLDYRRCDPKAPGYATMQGDARGLARTSFAAGRGAEFDYSLERSRNKRSRAKYLLELDSGVQYDNRGIHQCL